MKKIVLLVVMILGVAFSGISQETQNAKTTKHVCTEMCKDGKHVYKHGEKGHKCTKECQAKKM